MVSIDEYLEHCNTLQKEPRFRYDGSLSRECDWKAVFLESAARECIADLLAHDIPFDLLVEEGTLVILPS
jgi:hypothetical protein